MCKGLESGEPRPEDESIVDFALRLASEATEAELGRQPVDGAAEHDHYIYGWRKRSDRREAPDDGLTAES
jgi:hypothetical protein